MGTEITTTRGLVAIQRAEPGDVMAYRDLRLEALREHPIAFAMDYAVEADKPLSYWEERLRAPDDETVIYFAIQNAKFVGMCGAHRESSPKLQHSGWIWGVYVQRAWRGLGIADVLIQECIGWARAHGLTIVKLGVTTTNAAAIGCYLRCGFAVYGVEPEAIRYEDKLYDELLMARAV